MVALPVAGDVANVTVVHPERDLEPNHGVAFLDDFEDIAWDIGEGGSSFEEELNLFKKAWLVVLISPWTIGRGV